jgi:hypothetical protein
MMPRFLPRCVLSHAVLLGPLAVFPHASDVAIRLVDVAEQAGMTLLNICGDDIKDYIVEVNGNGAALFDYDNDGDMDALVVNGSTLARMKEGGDRMVALFRNDGKGHFADVTPGSGLDVRGWGMGACVADYDSDGFQDIYVTAYGPDVLARNNGDGTFTDVTARARLGDPRWSTNCAFGDYDRDGDLDLYVANYLAFDERTIPKRGSSEHCRYMGADVMCGPKGLRGEPDILYRNNGDGTFTDATRAAGIVDPGYYGFGVLFSDLDDDRNDGSGRFTDATAAGSAGVPGWSSSAAFVDYDHDGRLDLFVGRYLTWAWESNPLCPAADGSGRAYCHPKNFAAVPSVLLRNNGDGTFTEASKASGIAAHPGKALGVAIHDYDRDGWIDLFVANDSVPQFSSATRARARSTKSHSRPASRSTTMAGPLPGWESTSRTTTTTACPTRS